MKRLTWISFFVVLGFVIISSEVMVTIVTYALSGLLLWLIIALFLELIVALHRRYTRGKLT